MPWLAALLFSTVTASGDEPAAEQKDITPPAGQRKPLAWIDSWDKGLARAQQYRQPVLVRITGADCPHCRRMSEEIEQAEVQAELKRWALITLDIDGSPEKSQRLGVEKIPAFRLLTPTGKLVAAADGVIKADDFVAWLTSRFDEATAAPSAELTGVDEPDEAAIAALIQEFRNRDAAVREAAIRRLLPYPQASAASVVTAFIDGGLSTQLAALELLREWQAPLDGLDPWRKETFTAEKVQSLTDWAGDVQPPSDSARRERLTSRELAEAKDLLNRLAAATATEAVAMRERLARYGAPLLPLVYEQLRSAATDELRERLTAVRYRLVAADSLALKWPGGIDRLASTDANIRQQAADELARRAAPADERLLLELFSDSSPLVREISLRALKELGGESVQSALLQLLADPEPNVRAAVLKQLLESPSAAILPAIVKFARREADPDLVVHAIRVLREIPSKAAHAPLTELLTHDNWSVRAEAAEALGNAVGRHSHLSEEDKVEIYVTMVGLLEDADLFVISRAISVLAEADLVTAVPPLVKAAETHPELAAEVVKALSQGQKQRQVAAVHLRKFCQHENAKVRAAAIAGLCQMQESQIEDVLEATLQDASADVRIAAASGLFQILNARRHQFEQMQTPEPELAAFPPDNSSGGFWESVIGLFGARNVAPRKASVPAVAEAEVAPDDPPSFPDPPALPESSDADAVAQSVDDSPYDAQLQRIRQGKLFLSRQHALSQWLLPMLTQERVEERLAGAVALAALGHDADAVPLLMSMADAEPRLASKLAPALPWLLPADRQALWDKLVSLARDSTDLYTLAMTFAQIPSSQSERNLWRLSEHERVDGTAAEAIRSAFMQYYLGGYQYQLEQLPSRMRKTAVAAGTEHAQSDVFWTKIIALSLLLSVDRDAAGEISRKMVDDPKLEPNLRSDALQVLLLSLYDSAAEQLAVEHLSDSQEESRRTSLNFLALGSESITNLRQGQFTLRSDYGQSFLAEFTAGEPISPEAPDSLTVDAVLPLLKSPDRRTAALAGYLLALLERDDGLDALIGYWEHDEKSDSKWARLVYRAIVRLDDGGRVDVLRKIFERWNNERERYNLREFYWTIRSMTGPEILALRKAIRDEVGVDQLK